MVSAQGWPAVHTERLGGWLLQAADGFTGRANSVVPLGSPGAPLDQALAMVQDFYEARGLPPRIQVVVGSALEASLRSRGWEVLASGKEAYASAEVQVAPLATMLDRLAGTPEADVRLTTDLDETWLELYGRTTTQAAVRHVLGGPPGQATLARVVVDGQGVVGIGRGVVTPPWLGVAAVEVTASMRRRGLARAIMARLGNWALDRGAAWVYLQVGSDNAAARSLYGRLGFTVDHAYRYYTPPSPPG